MKKMFIIPALLAASFSVNAASITSLNDGFENEGQAGYVLNYTNFNNWVVTDGTVDLKTASGAWIKSCSSGNFCVDLDGSTGDAGVLTTKEGFAEGSYKVSFDLSGNQRGWASTLDIISVTFGTGNDLLSELAIEWNKIWDSSKSEWKTFSFVVDVADGDKLSFANLGGDNEGILLDNVSVSAVPVPAAAFLFAPALLGFMGLRRKAIKSA